MKDGSWFEGNFVDGEIDGHGEKHFANGSHYTGSFHLGEFDGDGVFESSNGDRYEGSFKDNKRHGEGHLEFANGNTYNGYFLAHRFHGNGQFKAVNGYSYEGQFSNGERSGQGSARWPSGSSYEGGWLKNRMHGMGKFICAKSGINYKGSWDGGKPMESSTFVVAKFHFSPSDQCTIKEDGEGTSTNKGKKEKEKPKKGGKDVKKPGGQPSKRPSTAAAFSLDLPPYVAPVQPMYEFSRGHRLPQIHVECVRDMSEQESLCLEKEEKNHWEKIKEEVNAEMDPSLAAGKLQQDLELLSSERAPRYHVCKGESNRRLKLTFHRLIIDENSKNQPLSEITDSDILHMISEPLSFYLARPTLQEVSESPSRMQKEGLIAHFLSSPTCRVQGSNFTMTLQSTNQQCDVQSIDGNPAFPLLDSDYAKTPQLRISPFSLDEFFDPSLGFTISFDFYLKLKMEDFQTTPIVSLLSSLFLKIGIQQLFVRKESSSTAESQNEDQQSATDTPDCSLVLSVYSGANWKTELIPLSDEDFCEQQNSLFFAWHSLALSWSNETGIEIYFDGLKLVNEQKMNEGISYDLGSLNDACTDDNAEELVCEQIKIGGSGFAGAWKNFAIHSSAYKGLDLLSMSRCYTDWRFQEKQALEQEDNREAEWKKQHEPTPSTERSSRVSTEVELFERIQGASQAPHPWLFQDTTNGVAVFEGLVTSRRCLPGFHILLISNVKNEEKIVNSYLREYNTDTDVFQMHGPGIVKFSIGASET